MSDTLNGVRDQRDTGQADSGVVVTTMDGTPGGPVVNSPLEGNPEAGPAPIAPALIEGPDLNDPKVKQALAQKITEKRYKGGGRDSIYERRDSMTLEERQDLENLDEESAAILDAQAGHARAATASQTPLAPRAAAAPGPVAPGPAAPGAPVASNEKNYRLSIYGQEQLVTEAEVIQHGIQALQKQHGADVRMREASTYEARLNAWRDDLQRTADDLARRAQTAPAQAQPRMAGTPAPTSPGAAGQIDTATVQKALDAFANDDAQGAAVALQQAVQDALNAGRPAPVPTAPAPATGEIPRLQPAAGDPWSETDRAGANRVFNGEFAHFTDAQFNAAKGALDEAMADPANLGAKLETLVRTVCRTTQRMMPATAAPPGPANPVQEELDNRRQLKARIPVTPPAASGRAAPAAPAEVRYPNNSDYVQNLRRRSGSNSTR